jgi:hypothetical protein
LTRRSTDSPVAEPGTSGPKFSFVTQQVSLTADDFWIEVGGKRFTTLGAKVDVRSDPGSGTNNTYQTLELTWIEHEVEMRLFIYFDSDGKEWSSKEFRTYNGNAQADWVTFKGDFFRSPLGSPFTGVFDQAATDNSVTSHLHIEGLQLHAFLGLRSPVTSPQTPSTLLALAATIPVDDRPPFAIGDSVMLGAKSQLESAGFTVDAGESRQASDVIDLVARLRAEGRLGDTVVIHIGTNGDVTDTDLASIMINMPPDEVRHVWFLTVFADRPWIAGNNQRIIGLPVKYPNVSVG